MTFPSPVGGASLPGDFVPSVLFAVLYGCLLPVMIWRTLKRRLRIFMLLASTLFTIERIVNLSLRAAQAHDFTMRHSPRIVKWMQATYTLGFFVIGMDMISLLSCLLVNTTYGTSTASQAPVVEGALHAAGSSDTTLYKEIIEMHPINEVVREGAPYVEDEPHRRVQIRRFSALCSGAFLGALAAGILGNIFYDQFLFGDETRADLVFGLRYASTAIALVPIIAAIAIVIWASTNMERISQPGSRLILSVAFCVAVVAIYRLSVMFNRTDAIDSTAPEALNSPQSKAMFYVFHILPEWIAVALLYGCNTREICGTGVLGDYRRRDAVGERARRRGPGFC
ncbi:hypothetical protein HGRIS_002833 [Hohenbuehelia grisea]|uniref:Uncharacterized protein n=1 Tax=Hohenbuehelia grisea TaxID=104357 RepID=A0ABR3JNT5_9AGAR